jgi:hypothetical protein
MTPDELSQFHELLREDAPEAFLVTLEFEVGDPNKPTIITIPSTIPQLWSIYRMIHRGGLQESKAVALFGHVVLQHLEHAGISDELRSFDAIWDDFGAVLGLEKNRWESDEDLAISFCYSMLHERLITRATAAAIAPFLLTDKEPPAGWDSLAGSIKTDAWRLRVDRWADRHGLEPVGIRQRQPK